MHVGCLGVPPGGPKTFWTNGHCVFCIFENARKPPWRPITGRAEASAKSRRTNCVAKRECLSNGFCVFCMFEEHVLGSKPAEITRSGGGQISFPGVRGEPTGGGKPSTRLLVTAITLLHYHIFWLHQEDGDDDAGATNSSQPGGPRGAGGLFHCVLWMFQ